MPTLLPEGTQVPAGGDAYNLVPDIRAMVESQTTISATPNVVARDAVLVGLAAANRPASPADPVFASRADGPDLEVSTGDGEWRVVGVPEIFEGGSPIAEVITASALALQVDIPAKNYRRRLLAHGNLHGTSSSGTWDAALSVNTSSVATAQRFARLGAGGDTQSLTFTYILEPGVAGLVRLWFRLSTGPGSLTPSGFSSFTNLTVEAWRI